MNEIVYVTGNKFKAEYFSKIMGMDILHMKIDVDEIQSLDVRKVVEHKARQAYEMIKQPVIVEDTSVVFTALGSMPGPLIKWFLEELGQDGICKLLDGYDDRTAIAGSAIAYYDGKTLEIFEKELEGHISPRPQGLDGFGWNQIFIPKDADMTLAQMDEEIFKIYYHRVKAFDELKKFLKSK